MATGDRTETDDSILLGEEDVLAFFVSKSGEVRNSELVSHFRRALKTGQHRATNRQRFPRFINNLATVRLDENGRKVLTLKKKFRREDWASGDGSDCSADGGTTSTDAREAAETASGNDNNNNDDDDDDERMESQATEGEIAQDERNRMETDASDEKGQSTLGDITPTKTVSVTSEGDGRQEEMLADSELQEEQGDDTRTTSTSSHVEDTQPTSVSVNDVPAGDLREQEDTSRTKNSEGDEEKSSSDNDTAEQTQPGNDETQLEVFDDGGRGTKAAGSSELEEGTGEKSSVEIVVEDCPGAGGGADDAVDGRDILRVKQLARRIDEAAGKRATTITTKQVRGVATPLFQKSQDPSLKN